MLRTLSFILPFLFLLAACGSHDSGVATIGAASNANGSSLGSGTVIDGDGKVTQWVDHTQRDLVQTMLTAMANTTAENLAADAGCLGYDSSTCKDNLDFTPAQRLAAAKLAIEAAKLALVRLPKIKFKLLAQQPTATGDDGKDILVNARRSPTEDNTVEMAYSYANDMLTAGNFQSTVDFQHTFIHELIHFESTPSQGKAVGDIGDYGGVSGRRLVNRAAADVTGVYYRAMPLAAIKVTVDTAPSITADIDGKANDDFSTLDFNFSFGAATKSKLVEISIPGGGSYTLNGNTTTAEAGATMSVTGKAKIPLRTGSTKSTLHIRITDETGRDSIVDTAITPKVVAPTYYVLYRFISSTGYLSFSGLTTSADPNWTLQGPAFRVLLVKTRSCSRPLYAVISQNDYSFNTTSGTFLGYACDTPMAGYTDAFYEITGPRHIFSKDLTEVFTLVNSGQYINRGALTNVPR